MVILPLVVVLTLQVVLFFVLFVEICPQYNVQEILYCILFFQFGIYVVARLEQ